jgi:hypothetical protein
MTLITLLERWMERQEARYTTCAINFKTYAALMERAKQAMDRLIERDKSI